MVIVVFHISTDVEFMTCPMRISIIKSYKRSTKMSQISSWTEWETMDTALQNGVNLDSKVWVYFQQRGVVCWKKGVSVFLFQLQFTPRQEKVLEKVTKYKTNLLLLMQNFGAPSFDDKKLEVVAVFGSMQMAMSRVINLQHHRITQV